MDDVLVAYGQNGEPVRPEQGFPLRLVVPGWEGINNVKWLQANQGGGPALHGHDGNHQIPQPEAGRQIALVRIRIGTEIGHHPPFRRTTPARPWILRDHRLGLVRWGRHPQGRSIHRRRPDMEGRPASGAGGSKAHTRFSLPWNWNGEEAVLQSRCTDEQGEVQPTMAELAKLWGVDLDYFRKTSQIVGRLQCHSTLEGKPGWECAKCDFLTCSLLGLSCLPRVRRWHKRRLTRMLAEPQRKRKFRPGISPSGLTGRDCRPDTEPPRKARRSMRKVRLMSRPCWGRHSGWGSSDRRQGRHVERSPPLSPSEPSGATGHLRRRSGTISTAPCPEIKADRSTRTRSTLSPRSCSLRPASSKKATSWTPRRCRKSKCRIATDSFLSGLKIFQTNASGAAAGALALDDKFHCVSAL